jgi:SAM-dependent methyltransferase
MGVNMGTAEWSSDWQHRQHAVSFDFRAAMPVGTLTREYESFSDVILLKEAIRRGLADVAEIGCATGEFFRYLRTEYPNVRYRGFDVSEPAIQRALNKYPGGPFTVIKVDPAGLAETVWSGGTPDAVYCKDVLHHQVRPLEFLAALIQIPKDTVILRCRTRDTGPTEWNPEKSSQYHYDGSMPYIVINTDELIGQIQRLAPDAEVVVLRNHMVLGGLHQRSLPAACSLPETGTAETAIGIFLHSSSPGKVRIENRHDSKPSYTLLDRLWFATSRIRRALG